ncbi:hypothetical protein VNI00_007237 [Paramarasmius palmivorus]|uniref:Extracellular metalloproteinase n=1 Tax=Paramarasmius palmivorus TaxID=297713 RepID=A0AAW0D0C9_9AGAR
MSFRNLFASVLLAVLCTSINAAPAPSWLKHSTHGKRVIANGHTLQYYQPEAQFTTYGAGKPMANAKPFDEKEGLTSNTLTWIQNNMKLDDTSLVWQSGWSMKNMSCGYVNQAHDGIPFANAVANVMFKDNNAVSFGNSFIDKSKATIAPSKPAIDVKDAVAKAQSVLGGSNSGLKESTLKYWARPDGSAALVHAVQVQNRQTGTFFEAYVDAHNGEVISAADFVAHATFRALPIQKSNIDDGLEVIVDPENLQSSPNGWNSFLGENTTDTSGNNVVALALNTTEMFLEGTIGSNGSLTFDFTFDGSKDPTDKTNIDASRANAFYIANAFHDFTYLYGFTEKAFNFQADNFEKGGVGSDPVLMSVQDISGFNNANFLTLPDGQPGECRMFIFNEVSPREDGAMENAIPVHELAHGLSNRLTGGGTATCLQTLESKGLGEGWSDTVADWTQQTSAQTKDFVIGARVEGNPAGFRTQPYSVDPTVNTLTYASVGFLIEQHNIGEVWANMLHNVYAALVDEHGFSDKAMTDPNGSEGNVVFLHLLIDGLSLNPCNPTFQDARDAIIQADQNRYNGQNECLLWKAFASRGLGVNARRFQDDDTVPNNC